jgi:hypothetical protein
MKRNKYQKNKSNYKWDLFFYKFKYTLVSVFFKIVELK